MPKGKIHCAISKQRTKFGFEKLHSWMDEPHEDLGSDHRSKRHAYTKADRKKIKEFGESMKGPGWGDKAVVEWLFHIAIDNLNTAFKISKDIYGDNTYNFLKIGFSESGYIYADFERLPEFELQELIKSQE